MRVSHKNSLLAILAVFIWSSNFIVQKLGVVSLKPEEFTLIRFAFALPFLLFVGKPKENLLILTVIALFWNVINYNCLTTAIKFSQNISICSFIFQTCVIFGILFNWLLNGQKITLENAFGILLSLAGVYVLSGSVVNYDGEYFYTFVLPGVAAMSWGLGFSLIKRFRLGSDLNTMIWLTAVSFVLQGGVHIIQSQADFTFISQLNLNALACIGYAFLFSSVFAGMIWMYLCKRMSGHALSNYFLMVPLFATGLSAIFLNERITLSTIVGGILIIIGLMLNQEKKLTLGKIAHAVSRKNSLLYRSR
jgi:EamA-like transporter family.